METFLEKYTFETTEQDIKGRLWFIGRCYLATPKGKYAKRKLVFGYRFATQEKRDQYVAAFKENLSRNIARREAEKAEKVMAKKALINPFKVGDMFYDSWGYEQTNIDFYQVTGVTPKAVKVRRIAGKSVESAGFMSEYVSPVKNAFIGEEETKVLQVMTGMNGVTVYIKSRHGWISPIQEGERKLETSYA